MKEEDIRFCIYEWIRKDAPLSVQLVIIPNHVDDLIKRIINMEKQNKEKRLSSD